MLTSDKTDFKSKGHYIMTEAKYKQSLQTTVNNHMPTNWITQKFLGTYNPLRLLFQEEIENLKRPVEGD